MIWLQIFPETKVYLKNAEDKQNQIKILLNKLRKYSPTNLKKIKAKEETLSAVEKLLNNRQEVINAFKTGIFSIHRWISNKKRIRRIRKKKLTNFLNTLRKNQKA